MGTRMLRIPKDSKFPIGTVVCSVIMLFLTFYSFSTNHGKFYSGFHSPIRSSGAFFIISEAIEFLWPILLIVFTLLFSKKNIRMISLALLMPLISYFCILLNDVFARYSFTTFINLELWGIILYLAVFIAFILTINNTIKSKKILIAICCITIAVGLLLTLIHSAPFAYFRAPSKSTDGNTNYLEYIYISSLLSFIAYVVGIIFLGFSLDNDPNKEYYENAIVERPAYYTGLNGEVAQSVELYEVKNIAVCVIFSLLTGGIYTLYWMYTLCKNIKLLNKDNSSCVGEYLCLILVPFYSLYWVYTRGKKISEAATKSNMTMNDNGVLYLILNLFALGLVSYALMQNQLNIAAQGLRAQYSNTGSSVQNPKYSTPVNVAANDPVERIQELHALKEQGLLSDEEFEAKKQELLTRI